MLSAHRRTESIQRVTDLSLDSKLVVSDERGASLPGLFNEIDWDKGLLLGLTGRLVRGRYAERLPALGRDELAMLGQRDAEWRQQFNVASLREAGVWMRNWSEVAADPETVGTQAAEHLQQGPRRWWLHIDLDVLDPEEFPAQGLPGVDDEPNGLTWEQLTATVSAAVALGGCLGMSVAIYDPDQDPDRSGAHHVLRLITDIMTAVPVAMSC